MGWHSDAEDDLIKHGAIASFSLGSTPAICLSA